MTMNEPQNLRLPDSPEAPDSETMDQRETESTSAATPSSTEAQATTATPPPTTDSEPDDDNDNSSSSGIVDGGRLRKPGPEDCWGDLNNYCRLCRRSRMFCPGCTRGMVGRVGHGDLFMGCGVLLRCPLCVGEQEAYDDKDFWQRNYWVPDRDIDPEVLSYTQMQREDVERKYPGWLARVADNPRRRDGQTPY